MRRRLHEHRLLSAVTFMQLDLTLVLFFHPLEKVEQMRENHPVAAEPTLAAPPPPHTHEPPPR